MATIIKDDSIFAAVYESTEGTAAYPSSATDGYMQLVIDGTELSSTRETKDRNIFTGTLTQATPRLGMKASAGKFVCEMKASGTEGSQPDYGILLESLLPTVSTRSSAITSRAATNTSAIIAIEDADIASFTVNDIVCVKETGAYHIAVVTAKVSTGGAATITVFPTKATGIFTSGVVISKSVTFKPADSGHKSYTATAYWGDSIRESSIGSRTSSMMLDAFNTGELAKLAFGFEGMTFSHTASSSAAYTPTFDSSLPPVILSANIYKDGTSINVNGVSVSIEQPIKFLTSTASANGRFAGRAGGKRKVTGKIDPYMSGDSVATFTNWQAGTTFSLFGFCAIPSSTSGQFDLGSIVAFYMPSCFINVPKIGESDGVLIENIEFTADGGTNGTSAEFIMGFI